VVITVDTVSGEVTLVDPDDFTKFHVDARGAGDVGEALASAGAGRLDGDHAFIDTDWLRATAAGTPEWAEGFTKMLGYAQSKGWIDEHGAVQAHIERI
jgi:hypothetical protein